jgi:hypothetical protein
VVPHNGFSAWNASSTIVSTGSSCPRSTRHHVKDRLDITGARWGLGAETFLKLRASTANDDLDDYWTYHLDRERQRIHQ